VLSPSALKNNRNVEMIIAKTLAACALAAGIAAAAVSTVQAGEEPAVRSYGVAQAISYSFGSKRTVGYFTAREGVCALTMFLADADEDSAARSATKMTVTVKPGHSAQLASVEGHGLDVACSADATSVEVRRTGLRAALATQ
jgi:hypothetical protein